MIVAQRIMGIDPSQPEQVFQLVMLHTGTMFAVLVYFWPRWQRLWNTDPGASDDRTPRDQFLKMLILATVVTGVVGLGLKFLIERVVMVGLLKYPKGEVEELFKHLPLLAAALAAVGVVILFAGAGESANTGGRLTNKATLWTGAVQGLCLPFRGFSRSGATISTGLFCGLSRTLCEDFSFALAIVLTPPVQAYSVYKLLKVHALSTSVLREILIPGLVGMIFSFVAGLLALRFLSAVLERGRWKYFGYYCLAAAALVCAVHFLIPPA